jgi:hypothetical protein
MSIKKLVFIILLFWMPASFAAVPYIVTSDTSDGPVTGWDGSETKGAAITIWGLNFGTAAHTSYIEVGGQTLYADESGVAEWGAVTNPTTPTLGNAQLQRITFYLNSSMTTTGTAPNTTIKVTTSDGTSNTIPFHCHTLGSSKILFVDKDAGSDAIARTSVSLSSPWQTLGKVRASALEGDKIYIMAGTYTTEDSYGAMMNFYNAAWGNGTAYNSILLTAYPTENVVIGAGDDTEYFLWVDGTADYHHFNYWTISKLTVNVHNKAIVFWQDVWQTANAVFDNVRIIGNSLTHTFNAITNGYGFTVNLYGDLNDLYIRANYFHDGSGGWAPENASKYYIYLGGGPPSILGVAASSDGIYIDWNEFYNSSGRGIDIYGHKTNDYFDNVYINNNYIHHMGANPLVIGGGDSNDAVEDQDYRSIGTAYIYNNIIADAGAQIKIGDGSWGSHGGIFYFYNNTVYEVAQDASLGNTCVFQIAGPPTTLNMINNIIDSDSTANCFITEYGSHGDPGENMSGSYNIWYRSAGIPSWSTTGDLDNTDPEMTDPANEDFTLQSGSPAIEAGYDTSAIVVKDFFGNDRTVPLNIGIYEGITVDETAPTAVSASILADGTHVRLIASENVQFGAGGTGGGALTGCSGGATTLGTPSANGSYVEWPITNRTVYKGETSCVLAYTQPTDGLQDTAETPNDMATFADLEVTTTNAPALSVGTPTASVSNSNGSSAASNTNGSTVFQ